jgi:hypothetical protein
MNFFLMFSKQNFKHFNDQNCQRNKYSVFRKVKKFAKNNILFQNEGDIEESQVSMVIDEDADSDSQYEMENEKDLSDSEIESDLEEDIVFGKLFDFSKD